MKLLRKISIYIILSLTVFVCVGKDCVSLLDHSLYGIENTSDKTELNDSIVSDIDVSEIEVTLNKDIYNFSLKYLPSERLTVSNYFFTQNIESCIWQPPKIS